MSRIGPAAKRVPPAGLILWLAAAAAWVVGLVVPWGATGTARADADWLAVLFTAAGLAAVAVAVLPGTPERRWDVAVAGLLLAAAAVTLFLRWSGLHTARLGGYWLLVSIVLGLLGMGVSLGHPRLPESGLEQSVVAAGMVLVVGAAAVLATPLWHRHADSLSAAEGRGWVAQTAPGKDPLAAARRAEAIVHRIGAAISHGAGNAAWRVPVATVVARYLDSAADSGSDCGTPMPATATYLSGLSERDVGRAEFNSGDVHRILRFAYAGKARSTVRSVLSTAWARIAQREVTVGLQRSVDSVGASGVPWSPAQYGACRATRLLGMIAAVDPDSAADISTGLTGQVDAALRENVIGEPRAMASVAAQGIGFARDLAGGGYTVGVVSRLSSLGVPFNHDDAHPGSSRAVATVTPQADPGNLFTDPATHRLLPIDRLDSPSARQAFAQWLNRASFGGGAIASSLDGDYHRWYRSGATTSA